MFNFNNFVTSTIGNETFLFIAEFFFFCCKLYLLIGLLLYDFKTKISKKFLFLLVAVLGCSLIHDTSWLIGSVRFLLLPELNFRALVFVCRIAWAFFMLQNHALMLFLEYLAHKDFRHTWYHLMLLAISLLSFFFFLYCAFFEFNTASLFLETLAMQIATMYIFPLFGPTLYTIIKKIYAKCLPNILTHQLKILITVVIIPYLLLEILSNKLIFFSFARSTSFYGIRYALLSISTMLITYGMYYCGKRMIGLRFLNSSGHVEAHTTFDFINDFKDILEQLSHVTATKELAHLTQTFFKSAFAIPIGRARLYIRKGNAEETDSYYDIANISTKVENFILTHDVPNSSLSIDLRQTRILIRDEIEFTNFYEEHVDCTVFLRFLEQIGADIFLPIYERKTIIGYVIVEHNARPGILYSSVERDEMLIFSSYMSNIINILKHGNLDALLQQEKELREELYHKHQEIQQYKESMRSFLRSTKDRKIGILFYKTKRFTLANQSAQEILDFDVNSNDGHPFVQTLKQIARKVYEYKAPQTIIARDSRGSKIVISGLPSLEANSVIIIMYYPEVADIIRSQFDLLKDPSSWDYLLYLETTQSGQLINQLVPGNGEKLLDFKIKLLTTALSKKATLLEMADDDLIATVEIIHHVSLRQTLHVLKLNASEKNDEVALTLCGINVLFAPKDESEPLLQKLDTIGTLFIQNIHLLSLETQHMLAEFITYGFYRRLKSDHKLFSNVRIICSTNKNLQTLISEGLFSKNLYNELHKTSLTMPSLMTLPEHEINELTHGFTEQALKTQTFKNLLELSDKEKSKLLDQRATSLQDFKTKIHQLLVQKSTKHNIYDQTEFDPSYHVNDPKLKEAISLGKKALKDPQIMALLWQKFQNQNKIATLLRVNRSSVNRRCKDYKII